MPKIRNSGFETATARLKKEPQGKPYWMPIDRGVALGYRRNVMGPGTWSVRGTSGREQWVKAIGKADDYEAANGRDVLGYYEALDQARNVARQRANGGGESAPTGRPATLADALDAYRDDLNARGGCPKNASRARRHLPPVLMAKSVMSLNSTELLAFRKALVEKDITPATVNRVMQCIKAACELAMQLDPRITSNRAWKVGLKTVAGASKARDVILDDDTVRELIDAAYAHDRKFGVLVETAAVTGARFSQLAGITAGDLLTDRLGVPPTRKGKVTTRDKKKPTYVPITTALAERLRKEAAGRAGEEKLLLRSDGTEWKDSFQIRPFREIARRCGLDPKRITLTALRHSSIVRQLLLNVPIRLVAANHDTSSAIIDRNYAKHITKHGDNLVRAALEAMEGTSNVVPMKRKRKA
jgi:integrase